MLANIRGEESPKQRSSPVLVLQPPPVKTNEKVSNPAFDLARRCMGFFPISSADMGKVVGFHGNSEGEEERFQKEGIESVREFLHLEMNISVNRVDDLRIKSVFYPPMGAVSKTLFAEFASEEEAAYVKKHARNLKTVNGERPKLVDYVPRSLVERHKGVESEAYKIRQKSLDPKTGRPTVATRIWLTDEIELRVRQKGDETPWSKILPNVLTNLPPQAPKRHLAINDMLERRRPNTPQFQHAQEKSAQLAKNQTQISNIYDILDDNCQI